MDINITRLFTNNNYSTCTIYIAMTMTMKIVYFDTWKQWINVHVNLPNKGKYKRLWPREPIGAVILVAIMGHLKWKK